MAEDDHRTRCADGPTSAPHVPPKKTFEPINLLKRRKARDKDQVAQAIAAARIRKKDRKISKTPFKRAQEFANECLAAERDAKRCRTLKYRKGFNKWKEHGLVFVIRTRNSPKTAPKTHNKLKLLRLSTMYSGVFLRYNDITAEMLAMVAPYVAWGTPTLKSIKDLIYKCGHAKVSGKSVPLSDNTVVEKSLGAFGIICIEDMVHEISNLGLHFRSVANFLDPFKLSPPQETPASEAEAPVGDCGSEINRLIELCI